MAEVDDVIFGPDPDLAPALAVIDRGQNENDGDVSDGDEEIEDEGVEDQQVSEVVTVPEQRMTTAAASASADRNNQNRIYVALYDKFPNEDPRAVQLFILETMSACAYAKR